jgi:hypothetical protein
MLTLNTTQILLIILIAIIFYAVFMRQRRRTGGWYDYPTRPSPGWWPERRADHREWREVHR